MRRFLVALVDEGRVSASTQTQALSALLFLYREVVGRDLGSVAIVRPAKPTRLPVVLGRDEVRGSGLRLLEALQLRVKDLDQVTREIVVRRGKGARDRITMLAESTRRELEAQLSMVRSCISATSSAGAGMLHSRARCIGSLPVPAATTFTSRCAAGGEAGGPGGRHPQAGDVS